MKALFLLHDEWYQFVKADLLASQYPLAGFVVIERKRAWAGEYLWKRARRIGFLKVADEALLRLYWTLFRGREDERRLRALMKEARKSIPASYVRPPVHRVHDINCTEAQEKLRELGPDVCVVMANPLMSAKTFTIPRLGMLVFHPGVVPEYRGTHSVFWAILNHDLRRIGWSLLKMDKGIDTGPVLAQGSIQGARPLDESYVIIQHRSHLEGIPHVAEVLRKLERGEQPETPMANRKSTNYTHPGLSDYLKLRRALRKLKRDGAL
jgi:folate-dependent phosphoribosylglycinamide formyltransferase PurN